MYGLLGLPSLLLPMARIITPEIRPLRFTASQSMLPCQRETSRIVLGILRLLLGQQLGQLLVLVISQLACGIENVQLGAHALQIAAFDHAFTGTVQHRFVLSGAVPHLKMLSSSWQRVLLSDPQLQQGQPVGLVNVQRIGICLGALHRSEGFPQGLVFCLELFHRFRHLRHLGLMLLLPGLFVQFVLRVLDIPLDWHCLIPGGLRVNTGNIDNLFYDGAAIGKMFDRDVMADLLNSSNRVMVHDLHVIHQPAQCQVRCFG
nr:MAG TPA: hypothetical protein [Caudoviricetes sp.]